MSGAWRTGAVNVGGGVSNRNGTTTFTNSTVSGNSAGYYGGGGVFNLDGLTVIEHITLTGNTAPADKGGGGQLR